MEFLAFIVPNLSGVSDVDKSDHSGQFLNKIFFKRFQKKHIGHIFEKGTKNGQEKSAPAAGFLGTYFEHLVLKFSDSNHGFNLRSSISRSVQFLAPQGRSARTFIPIS